MVLGHLTGQGQLEAPRSPRALPRGGGAARSARCRRRVRSPQASCGLRHLRRAAPASIGSTATARVTVGTATRLRAPATWPSCQTRAASRPGVVRVAHPVRERPTSSAASFSVGACHWEAGRNPRRRSVAPSACRCCRGRPGPGRVPDVVVGGHDWIAWLAPVLAVTDSSGESIW